MAIAEAFLGDLVRGDTWAPITFTHTDDPATNFSGAIVRAKMRETASGPVVLQWSSEDGSAEGGNGFFRLGQKTHLQTAAIRPGFYYIEVEVTLGGIVKTYGRLTVNVLPD
jgi:hypothetical protein